MQNNEKDFYQILDNISFIISGDSKSGKMTLFFYMMSQLFKKKALIFTPQEFHLFNRRVKACMQQYYTQFADLEESLNVHYLKNDWKSLKQRYGFDFFIQELAYLITHSEEELIVIHRFGEYFEFQDRYEIQHVYSSLVKLCFDHGKKIVIIVNNTHENYDQIHKVADEFTDVSIKITVDDITNNRLVNIRDLFHNYEYPLLQFQILKNSLLLDFKEEDTLKESSSVKNVLICELDKFHDNFFDVCKYIFNKPGFSVKRATSLQTILQHMFVSPDVVIVLMKRTEENFETVQSIKMYLPNSPIVAILDQSFVRSEDAHKALRYGIDELFSNELVLEKLILAFEKASKTLFYTKAMESLPKYPNILNSLDEMKTLAQACLDKHILFSVFVFKISDEAAISRPSREYDYLFKGEDSKLYYLALNTASKDVHNIMKNFDASELLCSWEPIKQTDLEDCWA